jgi:hypothetical protein
MTQPPDPIVELARARSEARARRDWAEADRLRAEIETAGWRVVDDGLASSLTPLHRPDLVIAGGVLHGHPASVPSRLAEPPRGIATLVVPLEGPEDGPAVVERLRSHLPPGTEVVLVVPVEVGGGLGPTLSFDRPPWSEEWDDASGGIRIESVGTAGRLGLAGSRDAGIRRASAPIVILLDPAAVPGGDLVTPLVHALDDPSVALAGRRGLAAADLRRPGPSPAAGAIAVDLGCVAFRRADYVARGPLDDRLNTEPFLALWWGLVLRDEGAGRQPRAVAVLEDLPVVLPAFPGQGADPASRPVRRDHYRLAAAFGRRSDLTSTPAGT